MPASCFLHVGSRDVRSLAAACPASVDEGRYIGCCAPFGRPFRLAGLPLQCFHGLLLIFSLVYARWRLQVPPTLAKGMRCFPAFAATEYVWEPIRAHAKGVMGTRKWNFQSFASPHQNAASGHAPQVFVSGPRLMHEICCL